VVQVSGDLNAYPADARRTISERGRVGRPPQLSYRNPVTTLANWSPPPVRARPGDVLAVRLALRERVC